MGSFNQTCALSGLPINPGDHLRWLLLIQRPYKDNDTIAPGCFYLPRNIALRASYNDYGEVKPVDEATQGKEFEKTLTYQLWLEQFKEDLFEQPQGENQYHEPAVKKDFNLSTFNWYLHDDRLFINKDQGPIRITKAYIREDVWQTALEIVPKHIKEDDYWTHKICTLEQYKKNFIKLVKKTTKNEKKYWKTLPPRSRWGLLDRRKYHPLDFLAGGGYAGGISFPSVNGIADTFSNILSRIADKEYSIADKQIITILEDFAELYLIHSFLSYMNQPWQQSLYGSQESRWNMKRGFHTALAIISTEQIKRMEEEEDD